MLTVIYSKILTDKLLKKIELFQGTFRIFRKRVYKLSFLSEISSKWTDYSDLQKAVVLFLFTDNFGQKKTTSNFLFFLLNYGSFHGSCSQKQILRQVLIEFLRKTKLG